MSHALPPPSSPSHLAAAPSNRNHHASISPTAIELRLKRDAELEEVRKRQLTKSYKACEAISEDDIQNSPAVNFQWESLAAQLRNSKLESKKQKEAAQKLHTSYRDDKTSAEAVMAKKAEKEELRKKQKDAERLLQSYRAHCHHAHAPLVGTNTATVGTGKKVSQQPQTVPVVLTADVRANDLKIEKKKEDQKVLQSIKLLSVLESLQERSKQTPPPALPASIHDKNDETTDNETIDPFEISITQDSNGIAPQSDAAPEIANNDSNTSDETGILIDSTQDANDIAPQSDAVNETDPLIDSTQDSNNIESPYPANDAPIIMPYNETKPPYDDSEEQFQRSRQPWRFLCKIICL